MEARWSSEPKAVSSSLTRDVFFGKLPRNMSLEFFLSVILLGVLGEILHDRGRVPGVCL